MAPQDENKLDGVVERVVYSNEETGWSVLRLTVRGQGEVVAVGNLLGVQPGESLSLQGQWIKDRKYGKQFRADSYKTVKPATFVGIERYLASGMIEGIGPSMAKKLVQAFGIDTLEIIDKTPERLTEVEGIGKVRSQRIRDAWQTQSRVRDIMVFLRGHGVSPALAAKIQQQYGAQALAVVKTKPHQLAQDLRGIGFKTADKIARHVGVAPDSPERVEAGVLHVLQQEVDRGHTYADRTDLENAAQDLLDVSIEDVSAGVERLANREDLILTPIPGFEGPGADQAAERFTGTAVYPTWLERTEAGLAKRLRALTAQGRLPLGLNTDKAVAWYEKEHSIQLADAQKRALTQALTAKVMVLTGGPGTGKTTLVKGILEILLRKEVKILLAAPTGRAAKRMQESTGREAKTLHRLLEYQPQTRTFARGPENPLSADLVVVDEASMLDTSLAFSLVKALSDDTRLILVGDVDQLPSIGSGRVLADLIDSGAVEVARLTEIFRQAQASLIVVNAHRIRAGLMPVNAAQRRGPQAQESQDSDFFFIEKEDPDAIIDVIRRLVADRIPNHFRLDAKSEIQILTPMRRGQLGVTNLNAELQALLNPDGQAIQKGGHLIRQGDRVMQRRNNYDLGVFNGDIGTVVGFDLQEQRASVAMEDQTVVYPFKSMDELNLAYACSIHKSQGSEYPCVIIPLHTQHYTLLQRNLIYTAVTRGRKLVIIVGSRRALDIAVHQQTSNRRHTLLVERLRGMNLSEST